MIVIQCVDNRGGTLFHNRRQSQDRLLRAHILADLAGRRLWMNAYSLQQFQRSLPPDQLVCVAEDFLSRAGKGEFCFVEGLPLGIELDEEAVPVDEPVDAACALLGLDPLYAACEGRLLAVCAPERAGAVLAALRALPGGEGAARIGQVTAARPGQVVLRNAFGGSRILGKLTGAQLPRIC